MALVQVSRPSEHTAVVTLDRPRGAQRPLDRPRHRARRGAGGHRRRQHRPGRSSSPAPGGRSAPDSTSRTTAWCRASTACRSARSPSGRCGCTRGWSTTLRGLRQPVIAAVNGPAYGGGMCLAMGCELRFAAPSATFNATGIVNGLTSTEMAAAWLLPRQIGATHANDLLLTGRVVDAEEALRLGLVSRVGRRRGRPRRRGGRRHGPVQPLRTGHDQGRAVGQPRDRRRWPRPSSSRTATS